MQQRGHRGVTMVLLGTIVVLAACSGKHFGMGDPSAHQPSPTAGKEGPPRSATPVSIPGDRPRYQHVAPPKQPTNIAAALDEAGQTSTHKRRPGELRRGDYIMSTVQQGFVQRNAFFTAKELTDPAYERKFRRDHPVRCDRGEIFVRRDIRWYEPVLPGAERCAAVIHIAVCRGKTLNRVETERTRAELVALEPEEPLAPHCGAYPGERNGKMNLFERQASQIVETASLACNGADVDPVRPLHVWPSTRFGVRTLIDPDLKKGGHLSDVDAIRRAPEVTLGPAAYRAGELQPQFMENGIVPNQGANIVVEQRIGKSSSGAGYCISLTATQGDRVWQRRYDRVLGTSPVEARPGWQRASAMLRDAHALAGALRAALVTAPFSPEAGGYSSDFNPVSKRTRRIR